MIRAGRLHKSTILSEKFRALKQSVQFARDRLVRNLFQRWTGNEDVLAAFHLRAHFAHVLAHPSSQTIARYGIAHLARDGEPDLQIPPLQVNQNDIPGGGRFAPAIHEPIVLVAAQTIAARKPIRLAQSRALPLHVRLCGQNLAAAGATGLQNVAAGASLHARAETVHLGTLTLLGLIRTNGTCHN